MQTIAEMKEVALMVIIEKMLGRYRNQHIGDLDEKMFVFFEKAKNVHYAKDGDTIKDAVKDL